jgi:hypothetical protein
VNDDLEEVVAFTVISVDYIEHNDSAMGRSMEIKEILSAYNLVTQTIWDPCATRNYYGNPVKSVGNHYTRRTRPA